MNSLYLAETTPEHIKQVAENMREADKTELKMGFGLTPREGLRLSVELAVVNLSIMYEDRCVGIMGGRRIRDRMGMVYMLASNELPKFKRELVSFAETMMTMLHVLLESNLLYNYVWSGNDMHRRWLKFAGFTEGDEVTQGVGQFLLVTRYREQY